MTTTVAIEVTNSSKSFKGKPALRGLSCTINEREMVALVGASGSGKSTLIRHMNGLHSGDSGSISIFGTALQTDGNFHSKIRLLRSQIGCIFQQFNLVNRLTVIENVLVGNLSRLSTFRSTFHLFTKEEKLQALAALERVGILEQAYKRASMLSGGQQQRVAIARALACHPKILLMDEPFGALDVQTKEAMQLFLLDLWKRTRCTILMITHDVEEAVFLSQRVYVMTARPGTIQREVIVDLPEERTYGMKREPKFQTYKHEITDLLRSKQDLGLVAV